MSNLLKFKGYYGSIEHSLEDEVLHGKIQCINDLVTYEAETISELKSAFEEAVTDYLQTCEEMGRAPDKTMSGTFNVRIGQDLHKKALLASAQSGQTLNDFVKSAIEEKLSSKREFHLHIEHKEQNEPSLRRFVASSQVELKWKGVMEKGMRH